MVDVVVDESSSASDSFPAFGILDDFESEDDDDNDNDERRSDDNLPESLEGDEEHKEEGDASAAVDVGVVVRLGEVATNAKAQRDEFDDASGDIRPRRRMQNRTAMTTGERGRIILRIDWPPAAAMVMTTTTTRKVCDCETEEEACMHDFPKATRVSLSLKDEKLQKAIHWRA